MSEKRVASPLQEKQSLKNPSNVRDGLIFAVMAYGLWGMMPFYLKQVETVSPIEIVAHRIVWSALFGALLIGIRQQWGEVRRVFASRSIVLVLFLAASFISLNWLVYVWAVGDARVLEASLGYYINPLMYVAAGVFVLGERLRRLQIIAIVIACVGVLVLTIGMGKLPWVALVLAMLFTGYGYIRKTTDVGAMPGLFVETLLLTPIAIFYLAWLWIGGTIVFLQQSTSINLLLIFAGPVTVMPLLFFALSARRLTMTTLGLTQYLGPTIQFIFGIIYGETFTIFHAISFGMIWIALFIFSIDAFKAVKQ